MITVEPWGKPLAKDWQRVWEESSDAWFWHRRDWADYQWSYGQSRLRQDLSFLVLNQGKAEAICPVFLEQMRAPHEGHTELAFAGTAIPAPAVSDRLTKRQRRDVLSAAYDHLAELARRHGAERIVVRRNPCVADDRVAEQMAEMREHGYFDVSFLTQVIDLSKGREQLWGDVRNSYRPLINRGQAGRRTDAQRLRAAERPPGAVFDAYQKLHAAAAGRVTRPQLTFDFDARLGRPRVGLLLARSAAARRRRDPSDTHFCSAPRMEPTTVQAAALRTLISLTSCIRCNGLQ